MSAIGTLADITSMFSIEGSIDGKLPEGLVPSHWDENVYRIPDDVCTHSNTLDPNNRKLEHLFVTFNFLQGTLPLEIHLLNGLNSINLQSGNLSGSIPSQLGLLTNLEAIGLDANLLTGSIPFEIGELTSLQLLSLARNYMGGFIPSSIGKLER